MYQQGSAMKKALRIIKFMIAYMFLGMAYLLMKLAAFSCGIAEWIAGVRISQKPPERSDLPWWP
jgi:hypothetical protein